MTLVNQTYRDLHNKLTSMGWDWTHPRICAYISELSKLHNIRYTPSTLPVAHINRLYRLLDVYQRIERRLRESLGSWNDELILDYFRQYSVRDADGVISNRMHYSCWLQLEMHIAENYAPF